MEVLKNNSKIVGLVAGATAIVTGLYILFRKESKKSLDYQDITEEEIQALLPAEVKAKILAKVNLAYEADLLTVNSIAQICFAAVNFAVPKYRIMTKRHRELRRQHFDDLEAYSRIVDDQADFDNKLIVNAQNEVIRELSLSEIVWDKSNTIYLEQGRRDVLLLHASLLQKLREALPTTKQLTKEEFLQIMQRVIELLKKEAGNIQNIISLVSHPGRATTVAVDRVNDMIQTEYEIEEEDLLRFIKENSEDLDVGKVYMEFHQTKTWLHICNNYIKHLLYDKKTCF